jgi:hypothetical protein
MENVPRLTRELLSQSRVIAHGHGIRDIDRLISRYGGTGSRWIKKSTTVIIINGRRAEVHWYEHPGIGRFEQKLKWL